VIPIVDKNISLAGCIPPKTGSTSWNKFWWPTADWVNGTWKFNSWQDQGNEFALDVDTGRVTLKNAFKDINAVFLQTRHPITRLISGRFKKWNIF